MLLRFNLQTAFKHKTMLDFVKLHRDFTMLCRVNLSLGGDWLKSQFTNIFKKYENYDKRDSTFQFHAKFHHIQTMQDSSNKIYLKRI